MARIHIVSKAKKDQGQCRVCGAFIKKGDPYKWIHPRYRAKVRACSDCSIPIYMTSSSKMVSIWEEQGRIDHSDSDSLRSFVETIREVSSEYQDSAERQQEYFPDSETASENQEKAESLEQWAEEIESLADRIDNNIDEIEKAQADLEEARSEAEEIVQACPVE